MESLTAHPRALLLAICRCPELALAEGDMGHPCHRIVSQQADVPQMRRHVPEPWNGDIERAPILFVSSNPSISRLEAYPVPGWDDERMAAYFHGRFGDASDAPITDGKRTLLLDGGRSRAVAFLAAIRNRASELLGAPAVPGRDYALTEIVHCKSAAERGVAEAEGRCVDTWLERVLSCSGADVVVAVGARAARRVLDGDHEGRDTVLRTKVLGDRERLLVLLPHPNARGRKTVPHVLGDEGQRRVREALGRSATGRAIRDEYAVRPQDPAALPAVDAAARRVIAEEPW